MTIPNNAPVFFSGVGGSGMSALAVLLAARGHDVHGSDRSHDRGESPEKFAVLARSGVRLFPQDGSGVDETIGMLVVSSAVEDSVPDVAAAKRLGIPICRRAAILADIFNAGRGIAVGGTSGKSTVTAMLGHILVRAGLEPTIINGAVSRDAEGAEGLGNVRIGQGDIVLIEADESDGSIALYDPAIAILTNITLDHKPVAELWPLFNDFLNRAQEAVVVNHDDPEARAMATGLYGPLLVSLDADCPFSTLRARDMKLGGDGAAMTVEDKETGQSALVRLRLPGRHNLSNALCAIGGACRAGVAFPDACAALESFGGIKRRLEVIGTAAGVTVIDDFAHNPDKITASLAALHDAPGRVIAIFQPHGFGPMKMMRREIAEAFAGGLGKDDILLMPEIFYAGGTTTRDISSADLIHDISGKEREAYFLPTREEIRAWLKPNVRAGDRVAVMGARDDTLTDFARAILEDIRGRGA